MTAETLSANPPVPQLQRISAQPENPFASLIPDQHIAIVPTFTLESGVILQDVPVAYTTRGDLSPSGDNAMVLCHALSGSADVSDWWGPLMGGAGRAFDYTRFFIVCLNSLGSPYGTASSVTRFNGDPALERYGPEFPLTTIRDDVNLHKIVLDDLGVRQIAAVVGGSMGGMLTLEYAYFGADYVRAIVPIATSSRHSAWGISWGEAQRQSIYCDPKYQDGYYSFDDPPSSGLGAARMAALLTYRSRDSFEARFGRNTPDASKQQTISGGALPSIPTNQHWTIHNDGHKTTRSPKPHCNYSHASPPPTPDGSTARSDADETMSQFTDPQFNGSTRFSPPTPPAPPSDQKRAKTHFSAQSYLRYQGDKFVRRFDSNCYISMTRKLDTHDISRHRVAAGIPNPIAVALSMINQPTLVIGIESDGLFTFAEQQEMAAAIPNSRLRTIESPEGHDAFLLQFEQVNTHILDFFNEVLPDIMQSPGLRQNAIDGLEEFSVGKMVKSSTFGEAEAEDITAW
ncbi:homoserine O- acetyltransferase [Pseudocyphellaria aurata]|nr:homoserine O- acetyltransferase [Pseudocyphellaria aurata]